MIEYYQSFEGTTCERCGTYIKNVYVITFADGFKLRVGSECIKKVLAETNISAYGTKYLKKQMKKIREYAELLELWKNCESVEDMESKGIGTSWACRNGEWRQMTDEEFTREKHNMTNILIPAWIEQTQAETAEKLKGVRIKTTT